MTCSMNARRTTTLVLCLGMAVSGFATAAKPTPAPSISGKIQFACATQSYWIGGEDLLFQMNPDGSGKVRSAFVPSVHTYGNVRISSKTYGGDQHRLWLVTATNPTQSQVSDVHVTRDGVNLALVLSGSDVTDPTTGLRRVVTYGGPQWSNDAQDSFFSVIANRRTIDTFQKKLLSMEFFVCRCHLGGQALDTLPGDFQPLTEFDPLVQPLIRHAKPSELSGGVMELRWDAPHSWSPDGTKVVIPFAPGGGLESLYVVDVSGVTDQPVDLETDGTVIYDSRVSSPLLDAEWSPSLTSSRIAFSSGMTVYTCATDGSGLTVLATSGSMPRWSPDARYIAYTESIEKGLQSPKVNIKRIPSAGGAATKLTADLDVNKSKWAYRWTP
jgi:hypothetical protein